MAELLLPKEEKCTGCGACANICPVGAITMVFSGNGYLFHKVDKKKCINCNRCTQICPSMHPQYVNDKEPAFYAVNAQDDVRVKSSSGGMFTLLANWIFKKNGYVCAAAYDEKMALRHMITNKPDDLDRFRGSKYLQSDAGSCYKETKKLLEAGEWVLFVGTPCQVAALNNVLQKQYENLVTVDLLCHGTPSQKFFNKYLQDVSDGKKVTNVAFRDKRFGWSADNILIQFEDGTEKTFQFTGKNADPYLVAFRKNLMHRYTCYDCQFAKYPRQGDFTIGDLWRSDKLDKKSNDGKGTSFLFVNNARAAQIFEEIQPETKYVHQIDAAAIGYDKIPNRVRSKDWLNPARKRFLESIKHQPFTKAVRQALDDVYDVGVPCVLYGDNIGNLLTYYALYYTLLEMGYSVRLFEKTLDSKKEDWPQAIEFVNRWFQPYARPRKWRTLTEMYELNTMCDRFLLGSDQVWLQGMNSVRSNMFFLQYIADNKPKAAFATSFGGPGARAGKAYNDEMVYHLNKFAFISSREDTGVAFGNEELKLDTKVKWTLDPVFLCDMKYYDKLVDSVKKNRTGEFIGSYTVVPRVRVNKLFAQAKKHFGDLPLECTVHSEKGKETLKAADQIGMSFPIEETLEIIKNCKFFLTDSFHGMCFAILFRKDFLVVPRDFPDRFTSLLNRLGLGDRIVKNDMSNISEDSFQPIDYDLVFERLAVLVDEARKDLKTALECPAKQGLSDKDICMKYLYEQGQEILDLKEQIKQLTALVENLSK